MRKNYGLLVLLSFGFVSLACPTRPIDGSVGGRAGSEEGDGSAGSGLGGKEGPGGTAGHSVGAAGAVDGGGGAVGAAGAGAVGGGSAGNGGGAGGAMAGSSGGRGVGGAGGQAGGGSGGTSGVGGNAPGNSGKILWARSASSVFLYGVAEGSVGVVVSGVLSGPANLGGAVLTPGGASDVALAEYSPSDGSHLFSTTFGSGSPSGTGVVYGHLDVLDASGSPIIQGSSKCDPAGSPACNQIDVGLGPLAPGGGSADDGFIGRYSITTGQATWVDRLVGPGTELLVASAEGPASTTFTVGFYNQTTSLISGTNTQTAQSLSGAGDKDVVIMQESDVTGAINMVKTYADAAYEQPYGIAWTGSDIILSGLFNGTMTAFGGSLQSQDVDVFVAKLTAAGTPLWVKPLGSAGPEGPAYVAVDAAGDIYLAGQISGSAMLGPYPIGGFGGLDVFVAKLNNADGTVAWATSFGSSGDDDADAITVNGGGQVFVTASVAGPVTSGGPSFGGIDAALVSYSKTGSHLWTKIIGTSGTDYGARAAASADGSFYANVNLGANIGPTVEGVTILGASDPTGLLLKVAP